MTIPKIIGKFKMQTSKLFNRTQNNNDKLWQRDYYEHIICDEHELNRIREYITNNPIQWESDRNNPNV